MDALRKQSPVTRLNYHINREETIETIDKMREAKDKLPPRIYSPRTDKAKINSAVGNYKGSFKTRPRKTDVKDLFLTKWTETDDVARLGPGNVDIFMLERYKVYERQFKDMTMRDVLKHHLYKMGAMSDFIFERAKLDKWNKLYQPLVNLQRTIAETTNKIHEMEEGKHITVEHKITAELDKIRDKLGDELRTEAFKKIRANAVDVEVGDYNVDGFEISDKEWSAGDESSQSNQESQT